MDSFPTCPDEWVLPRTALAGPSGIWRIVPSRPAVWPCGTRGKKNRFDQIGGVVKVPWTAPILSMPRPLPFCPADTFRGGIPGRVPHICIFAWQKHYDWVVVIRGVETPS